MADGYGFGGEGDWKTSVLLRPLKAMGRRPARRHLVHGGLHLPPRRPASAKSSARTCSRSARSIAAGPPALRDPSARHRRPGGPGPAGLRRRARARPSSSASADMGDRFRLVANEVDVVAPDEPLPKLPVGRAVWEPAPRFRRPPRRGSRPAARTTPCCRPPSAPSDRGLRGDAAHRAAHHRRSHHASHVRRPRSVERALLSTIRRVARRFSIDLLVGPPANCELVALAEPLEVRADDLGDPLELGRPGRRARESSSSGVLDGAARSAARRRRRRRPAGRRRPPRAPRAGGRGGRRAAWRTAPASAVATAAVGGDAAQASDRPPVRRRAAGRARAGRRRGSSAAAARWASEPLRPTWRAAPCSCSSRPRRSARDAAGSIAGERVRRRLLVRRDVLAAGVGERGELAAGVGGDDDEALVLELVERGIDRAGARRPPAAAALGDGLHELVAVPRLLGEQQQHGRADVTAGGPPAAAATVRVALPLAFGGTVMDRVMLAQLTAAPVGVMSQNSSYRHI